MRIPDLRIPVTAALAAIVLVPPVTAADEETSEEKEPEKIIVIAERVPKQESEIGASASVLTEAEITARQEINVLDLLRSLPGISVSRNGGFGTVSSLRIRGAEAGQTLVLIDGVKVNDLSSPDGAFNFATLNADNIERIEVLRGPQSTLYGSDAIGGVINIITRKADRGVNASGALEGGSFSSFRGSLNAGYAEGGFKANVGLSGFRTSGISAADEDAGNTEADGFRTVAFQANLSQEVSDALTVDGFVRHADSRAEFDRFDFLAGTFVDGDGVTESEDLQAALGATWRVFGGRVESRVQVSWANLDRFDVENGAPTFDSESRNRTVDLQSTIQADERLTFVVGGQLQDNRITTETFGAFASMLEGEADIDSVFGEIVAEPVDGLHLTFGARHDDHERFGGHTTLRATFAYAIGETGATIRASWGEGFKAPTLFQLFSAFGDPDLRPEESEGWEAGLEQELAGGRIRVAATYFHRDTTNQIDFDVVTFRFANIARTRAKGVEVIVHAEVTDNLNLDANYTRIDSLNLDTGMALVRRPENLFNANVSWTPGERWTVSGGVNHTGKQLDGGVFLDPFTVVDLRVSYRLGDHVSLYGRIENAFDEDYQEVLGFGTPGFAAYGGVRGNF